MLNKISIISECYAYKNKSDSNLDNQKNLYTPLKIFLAFLIFSIFLLMAAGPSFAATAILKWEPNQEPDLSHYIVFYGESSRNYTNSLRVPKEQTEYTIENLEEGKTYYFALKAVDLAGQESEFSQEVLKKTPIEVDENQLEEGWFQEQDWIEAGTVRINHEWHTVTLQKEFLNPVVIVGPPTENGGDPCIVRIRNISSDSFDIHIQEWSYLDQWHLYEDVSYVVVEAGVHTLPDGSIWEAGTLKLSGNNKWVKKELDSVFAQPPMIFVSMQTMNDELPAALRLKYVDNESFNISMQLEEALWEKAEHGEETVGYLATEQSPSTGDMIWSLKNDHIYRAIGNNLDLKIQVEEEQSFDEETWHLYEQIGILALGEHIIAQIQTFNGNNTATVRIN